MCHYTTGAFPHQHVPWITFWVKEGPSNSETVMKREMCEMSLLNQHEGQHVSMKTNLQKKVKTATAVNLQCWLSDLQQ